MAITTYAPVILAIGLLTTDSHIAQQRREAPTKQEDPWDSGPPPNPKEPASWTFTDRQTSGFVEAVNAQSITLHWPERRVLKLRYDPKTGQQLSCTEERFAAVPGKQFALDATLAKGEYLNTGSPDDTYRIRDVKLGDRVLITFDRRNGINTCKTIRITRRPGGDVPPAPGEKPTAFHKHHEQANADQQWEENRLPYPRKYWPSYLGQDGNFYATPYPSDSKVIVAVPPIAPPPREIKPAVVPDVRQR